MSRVRQLRVLGGGTEDAWMDGAIKVAFASTDLKHVNQHFGAAESFAVYGVDAQRSALVEVIQFAAQTMDGNENKLGAKMHALEGCIAVYCQAVGGSAIRQLKAIGIQPVKVGEGTDIAALLESLREELQQGPSAWLARAIEARKPRAADRFDAMEAQGWEE
jgi:nitrogen fixation protein NifX